MAREEPTPVIPSVADPLGPSPVAFLREHAGWLFAPDLGVCLVGSQALALACRSAGERGPQPMDVDLSWLLDVDAGTTLLQDRDVFVATTDGSRARGTLAMKIGGRRIEVTTLRGGEPGQTTAQRIAADLGERDMTIGALAFELATAQLHDPHGGLEHWRHRRVVPVGNPAERVREHPVRWLRYYRKAHELGFVLERTIRSLGLPPQLLLELPPEAIALELRAVLAKCASPGRCLLELHEDGVLATLAPELARQFDGRPAGPQRWHPEVSQALHLTLALEWAVAHIAALDERDRIAVLLAVLCHDLGKGYTRDAHLPSHPGHERDGVRYVDSLLDRWPGLADPRSRMLARDVCALHVEVRHFDELRPGTLAELYDTFFRAKDYPVDLFAMAVAADTAGRLDCGHLGTDTGHRVADDLTWLRDVCSKVDAGALRQRHPDDVDAFRAALHQARARAIADERPRRRGH
jgi:tRNA nucleotidyltransferase/poly(A) polymerase